MAVNAFANDLVDLNDERRALVETLREYSANKAGTPEQRAALTEDGIEQHHEGVYRELAELGFVGIGFPEDLGGGGGSIVDVSLFLEEAFFGQLPIMGISTSLVAGEAIERHASDELKRDLIGRVCAGDTFAIGMSEPEAGSDLANLRCKAERVDGGWLVNGQKTWSSNAHFAKRCMLMVRTDSSGRKHEGISMLDVDLEQDGIDIRHIPTMGGRETNDVFYTDVFVPEDRVIGEIGNGWKQLMGGLNRERVLIAAIFIGHARRALQDLLDYITERKQFGQPIGSFQAMRHRFAELATEVEISRLMVHELARRLEADPRRVGPRESSMLKLKVTEVAKRVALEGVQMMGGYGYANEYGMERHLRIALGATIYGGTNEIQRDIIGKTYGL
ncbi:acyl-CoA dehydrogenase family protein [Patulibacter brassicae]|jgi:alkylation response protein AidB-like acyl-CoA dehydrogenase|uniref:Acyl-CoA dehydrogenase family protein n=1 Tax=Patulibacter brassicae TaxID=1705717 RepID=A0ABU4VR25_9ACTN|nr:acyl-CoA dehydrogenase family protein [Patulibacter brassicae]MDX8153333.1 acyl-CoA dehydrogenase family protein [Patulibacter brassicae]